MKPIQVRYLLSVTGYSYEKASKELGRTKPSIMAESILRRWAADKKIDVPNEEDIEEIED